MNRQINLVINGKGGPAVPSVSASAPSSRTNKAQARESRTIRQTRRLQAFSVRAPPRSRRLRVPFPDSMMPLLRSRISAATKRSQLCAIAIVPRQSMCASFAHENVHVSVLLIAFTEFLF
jgi:hypothetical protein